MASALLKLDDTFKRHKNWKEGSLKYHLHKKAEASLNAGLDLKDAVKLPPGEEFNDWIAVHVVDFFNRVNLLYGTICRHCTSTSCPVMSGGPKYEYFWQDADKYKKPTKLSAPDYIGELMDWIEALINDENIFPIDAGIPFPKGFVNVCKKILSRLYRVFVHVYIHHFKEIGKISGAEAHINTCYKHFYFFVTVHNLVEKKELEPLKELSAKLCK